MQTSEKPRGAGSARKLVLLAGAAALLLFGVLFGVTLFVLSRTSSPAKQEPAQERQTLEGDAQPDNQGSTPGKPAKEVASVTGQPADVTGAPESLGLGFNNAEQVVAVSEDQSLLVWVAGNNLELASRDQQGNITKTTRIATGEITLPAITKHGSLLSVAWVERNKTKESARAAVSLDAGVTFSSPETLGDGSGISLASGENTLTAVWHEGREGDPSKIMYSQFSSSRWSDAARLDTSAKTPLWPSVARSGEHIYVAWRDNRNGPYSIWLRRSSDNGSTWQAEQNVVPEQSGDPDLCAPDGQNVHLAHHGKGKINLLTSDDSGAAFRKLEEVGNGYFAHLSCSSSKVGLAWEATTESAKAENKKVGWAVYRSDGSRMNSGEIGDGSTAASTIFVKADEAELIWVNVGSDPLAGTLRHQFISFE